MKEEMDAEHLNRVLSRRGEFEQLNRRLSQAPGAFKGSPSDSLTSSEGGVLSEPYETPFLLAAEMDRYNASHPDGGVVGEHPGEAELVRDFLECSGARHVDDTDDGVQQGGRYVVAPPAARRHGMYVAVPDPSTGRLKAVPRSQFAQQPAVDRTVNLAKSYPLTEREARESERRRMTYELALLEPWRLQLEDDQTPAEKMTSTEGWDRLR